MSNPYLSFRQLTLAVFAVCSVPTLCFASIEISATGSGWYRSNGNHVGVNPNYIVQVNGSANNRNFFVFDLTSVADTILSAVLRLENPQTLNNGIASTYTLYDISTSVTSLVADQTGATGIYADLGTGTSYGSVALGSSVSAGLIEIPLNTAAVSALNSTSGLFALGGALSVVGSTPAQLFTGTSGPEYIRTLILEVEQPVIPPSTGVVPEPMSFAVWSTIALVIGLGVFARRVKGNRTDNWPLLS